MLPPDWHPHRRDDGELVGWIRACGDGWIGADLFGRDVTGVTEWLDAEAALERHGIGWLAEIWMLERPDAAPLRVRIVEATPGQAGQAGRIRAGRIVVQTDDFGAIDAPVERFELPWPAPAGLRPRRTGDPDGRVFAPRRD